ncbi:MAG: DNA alkylation repair protein, partial [Actinomycetota bacterium]
YMPHVFFVQKYGLDDFEAAMRVQYELTKRFSAESSIRAFLVRYPENTYARLVEWAHDESVHVRRLVSEGTRPRLPWAPRLRAFQEDPRPVIALLELLKDDPERYVQRSVANNLNDIGKDHPDLAVEVCRRWSTGASPGREWIVRHALRSLVKEAHRGALETLGVGGKPNVSVTGVRLVPPSVKLGGELRFSFEIASTGDRVQELLIDYAVHFVKANGATGRRCSSSARSCCLPRLGWSWGVPSPSRT